MGRFSYVNDFNDRGRVKRVYVQGDGGISFVGPRISSKLVRARYEWGDGAVLFAFATIELEQGSRRIRWRGSQGISSYEILGSGGAGAKLGRCDGR